MKKNITYVEAQRFEDAIKASGVATEEKAGWILVGPHGTKGPRLYVPKTKRVGRIDVCGLGGKGTVPVDADEKRGAVTHQVDMTGSEEQILATFARLLGELEHAAPSPKKERAPRAAKGTQAPVEAAPAKGRGKDRLAKIAERASQLASDEGPAQAE